MFKNSRQPDSLETPKQTVKKFKTVKYLDRDVDIQQFSGSRTKTKSSGRIEPN